MNKTLKKIAWCGIFTALSLISFMLESLFPPLFIPGARMGISNIFILLALIYLGVPYGIFSLIIKCILGGIFTGNLAAILYSLPSGIISLIVEIVLIYFTEKISIVAVSVLGAVINIVLQNLTFCIVSNSFYFLSYTPYLILIGAVSGLIVGLAIYFVIKRLPLRRN